MRVSSHALTISGESCVQTQAMIRLVLSSDKERVSSQPHDLYYASHRILYYMRPLKETKKKDRWRPKRHLDRSREKM